MFSNTLKINPSQPSVEQTVTIGRNFDVVYKVLSETTAGAVSVVEHTLAPRALGAAPHKHTREDEISYIVEGQLAVLQGDQLTFASAGSYIVKPRGIFHTFWNPGMTTVRFIEMIAPGGFERYFYELAPLIPVNAAPDIQGLVALAGRYGLEFALERVPELCQKYGLNMG
jgi:mannose-6-phosphate isomerase-like protein (cupin superfamily)